MSEGDRRARKERVWQPEPLSAHLCYAPHLKVTSARRAGQIATADILIITRTRKYKFPVYIFPSGNTSILGRKTYKANLITEFQFKKIIIKSRWLTEM